jgi:hypothetical protein
MRKQLTHKEVDVFSVRMSLELETQLVQIPNPHLRFIRPSSNDMMSVPGRFDFVASFGEFEVLYEFEGPFDMFLCSRFPFFDARFRINQSGREDEAPAAGPLTVYTLTELGSATIFRLGRNENDRRGKLSRDAGHT